jgi:phosphatidate phosphatase LPIN
MTDLVDQMFPPVHRNVTAEYTDFNYWRPRVDEFELPDLEPTPASPALSARSDTSRLGRLRNFALVSRSSNSSLGDKNKAAAVAASTAMSDSRGGKTQRSSKPSSPLASPVLTAKDPEGSDTSSPNGSYRRERLLGMFGSIDAPLLEDTGFGEYEGMHGRRGQLEDDEEEDEDHKEDPEAAFDDDLLAAGEMDDIPFL